MLNMLKLKVDLLIKGVRGNLKLLRYGGGGPVGGVSLKIKDFVVNAPYIQKFAKLSPYEVVRINDKDKLLKNGKMIADVFLPKEPKYYKLHIDGIEMRKIVALDGINTLVTSVLRRCSHKRKCAFCSLERGKGYVEEKKPEQIAEVVRLAVEEDKSRSLVITTGTPSTPDKGALLIARVIKAVKEVVNVPIQVQIEPPEKLEFIDILYYAGADAISLNVETFDLKIRHKVVPEKPSIERYIKCLKYSSELFDKNVSSWILVGLGESFESVIEGSLKLCEIGVIPFIVPYRPNNGRRSCNSKYLMKIYARAAEIMKSYGIKPEGVAGCIKCQACSAISEAFKIIDNYQTEDL